MYETRTMKGTGDRKNQLENNKNDDKKHIGALKSYGIQNPRTKTKYIQESFC